MMYQKMQSPPRYNHLWKYTPWREVSPSKLSDNPQFEESGLVYLNSESEQSMGFSVQTEDSVSLSSEDIARACLSH